MANIALSTSVSLCEDTTRSFELYNLLQQAGYTPTNPLTIQLYVQDASGNYVPAPVGSYLVKVDADTIEIDLSGMPNFNGDLPIRILATDDAGAVITLDVDVTVAAVNDAPDGADGGAVIGEDSAYVFGVDDFGFVDSVEGDAFAGVIISTLPAGGQVLLDGSQVFVGDEINVADIIAGKLTFVPDGFTGDTSFTFQLV